MSDRIRDQTLLRVLIQLVIGINSVLHLVLAVCLYVLVSWGMYSFMLIRWES